MFHEDLTYVIEMIRKTKASRRKDGVKETINQQRTSARIPLVKHWTEFADENRRKYAATDKNGG